MNLRGGFWFFTIPLDLKALEFRLERVGAALEGLDRYIHFDGHVDDLLGDLLDLACSL